MTDILDINLIKKKLQEFATSRRWDKFHSPKNICMALTSEVGELNEIFQWLTEKESMEIDKSPRKYNMVKEELADVILYSILISLKLEINIEEAVFDKISKNSHKYPVNLVKGSSKKYNEYNT